MSTRYMFIQLYSLRKLQGIYFTDTKTTTVYAADTCYHSYMVYSVYSLQ